MKPRDVFPKIAPPRGGLDRLRRRMRAEGERSTKGWWSLAPVVAVALAAATVLVVMRGHADPLAAARSYGGASEVALGLARAPTEAVTLAGESRETAALVQVPTGDPHVAMYLVGTLE